MQYSESEALRLTLKRRLEFKFKLPTEPSLRTIADDLVELAENPASLQVALHWLHSPATSCPAPGMGRLGAATSSIGIQYH